MTGYFKSLIRPRTHKPLSMIKYDPVGEFFGVPAQRDEADVGGGNWQLSDGCCFWSRSGRGGRLGWGVYTVVSGLG
ncbi:hypothetical protein L873DRAFT_1804979 [Choiromyces venosus 120613-1]|uniref:Ribosomal protein L33 n=1 Tax=Choiromyces venosus 120613-1 TaxID=1336337 RepID=A0A3N4JQF4_9PEZI|nr:hypothetical protein L873DRAFT_1804979 [Choiromyces venosus 120613-1]